MTASDNYLKGMHILAVDDEPDILESIEDVLDESQVDMAGSYDEASKKIKETEYDLAILDIMGVDGLRLLEEAVERGIPSVMLTAHGLSQETLEMSVNKGALSYMPKDAMADMAGFLNEMFAEINKGDSPWQLLFKRLGGFFVKAFGPTWDGKSQEFWDEMERRHKKSKGHIAKP